MGMPGVSSMYRGALARRLSVSSSCTHSKGSSFTPPLIFSPERPLSVVMRRLPSWSALISRENTATGMLASTAALRAMFRAKAVLPTDGRAARMMRSLFCQPWVMRSMEGYPDGTPDGPVMPCSSCRLSSTELIMDPISCTSRFTLFWMAAKTLVWALSIRSSTLVDSSNDCFKISYEAEIRSRWMVFCLRILM